MKLAIVGVTGLVGSVILEVLTERKFPFLEFLPAASPRSVGNEIELKGDKYKVISVNEAMESKPDIAIFSAGSDTSKSWANYFAEKGCYVIDNSSAWRMDEKVPLVVPEVNANLLTKEDKIIANPNCSTIQLVVALAPLHQVYKIRRITVSTYQSVSGSGKIGVDQLMTERAGKEPKEKAYPHTIDLNCLPHGGDFLDNAFTSEEMKLVNETQKILNAPEIEVAATVVRVPVIGGHSESISVEFEKHFDLDTAREVLKKSKGISIQDDPAKNLYPMPINAHHKDDVFVGRLRKDLFNDKCLHMWVVSDNLRKGAATNAVQIAEHLLHNVIG